MDNNFESVIDLGDDQVLLSESKSSKYKSIFDFRSNNKFGSIFTYRNQHRSTISITSDFQKTLWRTITYYLILFFCYLLVFISFPFSMIPCLKRVKSNYQLVIFRLGKRLPVREPGFTLVFPCIDKYIAVNTCLRAFHVPPKQIITEDLGLVELGAEVHYEVVDAGLSVTVVQNLDGNLRRHVQTALISHIGGTKVKELGFGVNNIASSIQRSLYPIVTDIGVKIHRIQLSEIKIVEKAGFFVDQIPSGLSSLKTVFSALIGGGTNDTIANPFTLNWNPSASISTDSQSQSESLSETAVAPPIAVPLMTSSDDDGSDPEKLANVKVLDPAQIVDAIRPFLNQDVVREFQCVYTFRLIDPEKKTVQTFFMDLKHGSGSIGLGSPKNGTGNPIKADVTLSTVISVFRKLIQGAIRPFMAYMNGSLQIEGNISDAWRLDSLVEKFGDSVRKVL